MALPQKRHSPWDVCLQILNHKARVWKREQSQRPLIFQLRHSHSDGLTITDGTKAKSSSFGYIFLPQRTSTFRQWSWSMPWAYMYTYIFHTNSASPLATRCSTTEKWVNETWPFVISCLVPLNHPKERWISVGIHEQTYSGKTTGGQSCKACTNTGLVTSGVITTTLGPLLDNLQYYTHPWRAYNMAPRHPSVAVVQADSATLKNWSGDRWDQHVDLHGLVQQLWVVFGWKGRKWYSARIFLSTWEGIKARRVRKSTDKPCTTVCERRILQWTWHAQCRAAQG